jgi:hypothetical protein
LANPAFLSFELAACGPAWLADSFVISLYFQNIKLAGVNRQGLEVYIVGDFMGLWVIAWFYPLDKVSGPMREAFFRGGKKQIPRLPSRSLRLRSE